MNLMEIITNFLSSIINKTEEKLAKKKILSFQGYVKINDSCSGKGYFKKLNLGRQNSLQK